VDGVKMKGVILAGGLGTRLTPITKVTNKHLLPVYNKPMIYYPLQTLINAGIKDILIVSGPEHSGHFLRLLGGGKEFGVKFTYEIQEEPNGIAHALSLAEDFVEGEPFVVILGDNIFEDDISDFVKQFGEMRGGACVFLKEVPDANRFGVAEVKEDKIVSIEEKPKSPKSNYATVGLYMYDCTVFDIIRNLKPSARDQYEITDVNNAYLKKRQLNHFILKGFWSDAGTFESLFRATSFAKEREEKSTKSLDLFK
jgi:glucose-1-phosphate thymidylyltransferase